MSKLFNLEIQPDKIFLDDMGNCHFYNNKTKIHYSCHALDDGTIVRPFIHQFNTNSRGQIFGVTKHNSYPNWRRGNKQMYISTKSFQTEPSEPLPDVITSSNQKLFAQAYRFGNAKISDCEPGSVENVIQYLKKEGFSNVQPDDLQVIKWSHTNTESGIDIAYYDYKSGRSYKFVNGGKYYAQIEYTYDKDGNITSGRYW